MTYPLYLFLLLFLSDKRAIAGQRRVFLFSILSADVNPRTLYINSSNMDLVR